MTANAAAARDKNLVKDQPEKRGLNDNDLLLSMTLLNAVAVAVMIVMGGVTIGYGFGGAVLFFFVGLPIILVLCWTVLLPFGKQSWHAGLANIVMGLILCGIVAQIVSTHFL